MPPVALRAYGLYNIGMETESVAKAGAAGGTYPIKKKAVSPPGNDTAGASAAAANAAGPTGKAADTYAKGPGEALGGTSGKGGKINALA